MLHSRLSRRRVVGLMGALALTPALPRIAFASPLQQMTHVVSADFKVLYIWPIFVAKEKGFLPTRGSTSSTWRSAAARWAPRLLCRGTLSLPIWASPTRRTCLLRAAR